MARYIDADKLAAAIDNLIADDTEDIMWNRGAFIRTKRVKQLCEGFVEDVVKVVRCKDCQWIGMQRIEDRAYLRCRHPDAPVSGHECATLFVEPDWFCPLGKRSRIK